MGKNKLFLIITFFLVKSLCCQVSFERSLVEPVIMENNFLKLTIDKARGGVIRSIVFKPAQRELTEEFFTGKYWAGGIAEDRLAGQGYPEGEINQAKYEGELKREGDKQILTLSYLSKSDKNKDIEFIKKYILQDNETRVAIVWEIINHRKEKISLTPWVHNIVDRKLSFTCLPQLDGIKYIKPSADKFVDVVRNWIGAYSDNFFLYFTPKYCDITKYYYCYWNSYHSIEWSYNTINLAPGEKWETLYYVGIIPQVSKVGWVSPEIVSGYQWQENNLIVELASPINLGEVEIIFTLFNKDNLEKGEILKKTKEIILAGNNPLEISLQIPENFSEGKLEIVFNQNNKEIKLGETIESEENKIIFPLKKGISFEDVSLSEWKKTGKGFITREKGYQGGYLIKKTSEISIWEVDTQEKVFKDDILTPIGEKEQLEIYGAKRERVAFQIVIRNNSSENKLVKIDITPFISGKDKIGLKEIEIYRVGYVRTYTPSGLSTNIPVGLYPDPLISESSFSVEPKTNIPVWIIVNIPENINSGIYKSSLSVKIGKNQVIKTPVKLKIFDFGLPEKPYLKTDFGCWFLSESLLKEIGFQGSSKDFQQLCQENYLKHRITPREKSIPWDGDENEIINALNYYKEKEITSLYIPSFLVKNEIKFKEIVRILQKTGLTDIAFVYAYDEAPANLYPEIKEFCEYLHKIEPKLKFLGTIYGDNPEYLFGHVNIWCRGLQRSEWIRKRMQTGDEFWSANIGSANIEASNFNLRKEFWRIKSYGYCGCLYWNCIGGYGNDNPWKDPLVAGSNGNAHFLYPTKTKPINTIRWEMVAAGINDFDYISILEDKVKKIKLDEKNNNEYLDAANFLLNELFQDNFVENNITSPEILKTYRLKIGYLIENLK
ncbi:MAG TPA: DUF4091 domain-containing protein [Candidatus Ratteibacteria bacterium]|nr:DUF4091 domain-containing protein [Candidatus Ratteibacteria bacterium]